MMKQAFLRRLVVIGAHDQRPVGAGLLRLASQGDRMVGRIGPGPGNYRAAALGHLDAELDDSARFVVVQRRRLAGCAARNKTVRTLRDLPGHQLLESGFLDLPVAEGCDQRDERSPKHGFLRDERRNRSTIVPEGGGFKGARGAGPLAPTTKTP